MKVRIKKTGKITDVVGKPLICTYEDGHTQLYYVESFTTDGRKYRPFKPEDIEFLK